MSQDEIGPAREVLLGARGWRWRQWVNAFYPAEMPLEWRLAFYNTQFDCVFLPAEMWRRATRRQLAQWAEDTRDQFVFLLEGGVETSIPEEIRHRALCLQAQDARITWFDGQSDIRLLAAVLEQVREGPHFLLSRDGDLRQLERVRTLLQLMGVHA